MRRNVSAGQDIIDTRDVLKRISDLENDLSAVEHDGNTYDFTEPDALQSAADEAGVLDELEELVSLRKLIEDVRDVSGDSPEDGAALIADHYFETYAQDLVEDIGAINRDASWPNDCIDWELAAEQLQQDYSTVDFDGITYWVRS